MPRLKRMLSARARNPRGRLNARRLLLRRRPRPLSHQTTMIMPPLAVPSAPGSRPELPCAGAFARPSSLPTMRTRI